MKEVDNFIWLSYEVNSSTPSYGNGGTFTSEAIKSLSEGDSCNTSFWHLPNHLGTHVDVPKHFFKKGNSITDYPPNFWMFSRISVVRNLTYDTDLCIKVSDEFRKIPENTDLLLIYTGYCKHRSEKKYWNDNPGISSELPLFLRENYPFLRAVGIDSLSISPWRNRDKGREAHRAFLDPKEIGTPILLIEDMKLDELTNGINIDSIWVLPVRVSDSNGSPCTVLAGVSKC